MYLSALTTLCLSAVCSGVGSAAVAIAAAGVVVEEAAEVEVEGGLKDESRLARPSKDSKKYE